MFLFKVNQVNIEYINKYFWSFSAYLGSRVYL